MTFKRCLWILHGFAALPLFAAEPADLVVRGANVITMDTNRPRAEAFALAGGNFIAVGGVEDVAGFIGPRTKVLELSGKTVAPGFNDAHIHPSPVYAPDSRWAAVDCSPKNVRTIDELVEALARKAARTPQGQWVNGSRYQETKLGRHPTRHDLDRASTNHPIIISHSSGHQSVCNSLALRLAKVTRDTEDPPGGKFVREASGDLARVSASVPRKHCASGHSGVPSPNSRRIEKAASLPANSPISLSWLPIPPA